MEDSADYSASLDALSGGLGEIIAAWPTLPEAIKVGIAAMIKAVSDGTG